jgi:hypothetical protein
MNNNVQLSIKKINMLCKMNRPRLYGVSGALNDNGKKLPQHQNVPKGSPLYYGRQESLLNKIDNPTRINNFMGYNFPSPYQNPILNYGVGPQAANVTQEVLSTQNKDLFWKDPILKEPTIDNPFMNVMPMDYDEPSLFADYVRYEKSTYPSKKELQVRNMVKNNFEKGLIQNSDSLFWNRLNSERQFYSAPVGSVPNKQDEFGQWLYGVNAAAGGHNCKMGSIYQHYGVEYTDDSLLCTGFDVATPTNKGLLNGNLMSSVYGGGY